MYDCPHAVAQCQLSDSGYSDQPPGLGIYQAFNNNLKIYKGNVLFASHDHEFIETVANRIIELTPNGIIDKMMSYDEYISSDHIKEMRARMYGDK